MIIDNLHINIFVNYYVMIDTCVNMKTKFYCGYVHHIDENYIHLNGCISCKIAVPINSITRIIIRDVEDTDLGI